MKQNKIVKSENHDPFVDGAAVIEEAPHHVVYVVCVTHSVGSCRIASHRVVSHRVASHDRDVHDDPAVNSAACRHGPRLTREHFPLGWGKKKKKRAQKGPKKGLARKPPSARLNPLGFARKGVAPDSAG